METLEHYTKEEAKEIIAADRELQNDLAELNIYYELGELNHGFDYGNFFNYDADPTKVVIQWLIPNDNEFDYDYEKDAREIIANSLEEAIVLIRDIENARGEIDYSEN